MSLLNTYLPHLKGSRLIHFGRYALSRVTAPRFPGTLSFVCSVIRLAPRTSGTMALPVYWSEGCVPIHKLDLHCCIFRTNREPESMRKNKPSKKFSGTVQLVVFSTAAAGKGGCPVPLLPIGKCWYSDGGGIVWCIPSHPRTRIYSLCQDWQNMSVDGSSGAQTTDRSQ
jgi:hypothetical protein